MPGRYATALYSAAMKEKKIDAVEKDIKDLHVIYDSEFVMFLFHS